MIDDEKAMALTVISSMLANAARITSPQKLYAALQQIVAFWRLIPNDMRSKAVQLFQRLWEHKDVGFSTDPEIMKENTEVSFDIPKLEFLYSILPVADRAALRLGQTMKTLRSRGLEDAVARTQSKLYDKYGTRGLSIGHIVTTNDAQDFFVRCEESFGQIDNLEQFITKKDQILKKFNWWADNYTSFTLLIRPPELKNIDGLEARILSISEDPNNNVVTAHMVGSLENTQELLSILEKMKADKKINYLIKDQTINPVGTQYDFSVKLDFSK